MNIVITLLIAQCPIISNFLAGNLLLLSFLNFL